MEIEFCNPTINTSNSYINCFSQPIIQTDSLESHIFIYPMYFNSEDNLLANIQHSLSECRVSDDLLQIDKKHKLAQIFLEDIEINESNTSLNYLSVLELCAIALIYSSSKSKISFRQYITKVQKTISNIELEKFSGKYINFPLIQTENNNHLKNIVIDWRPAIIGLIQQTASNFPQKEILLSFFGGLVRALSEVVYWLCITNETISDNTIDIKLTDSNQILHSVIQRLKNYRLKIKIP